MRAALAIAVRVMRTGRLELDDTATARSDITGFDTVELDTTLRKARHEAQDMRFEHTGTLTLFGAMFAVAVISGAVVTAFLHGGNRARTDADAVTTTVAAMAADWQAQLPMHLGKVTELTAVTADGRQLNFYYRIASPTVYARLDFVALARKTDTVVCQSADDVALLQQGASYHYWFTDGTTPHRRYYDVVADDCSGPRNARAKRAGTGGLPATPVAQ